MTAIIQFSQDIPKVLLDFRVSMPKNDNKDMDLIKFRSDGCHITKYKSANPVITAISKQLYQSANFPDSCPLKAVSNFCDTRYILNNLNDIECKYVFQNVTYNVNNLSLNPDYFPGYTPEMSFTIKFSIYTGRVHLLASSLVASVIKKK